MCVLLWLVGMDFVLSPEWNFHTIAFLKNDSTFSLQCWSVKRIFLMYCNIFICPIPILGNQLKSILSIHSITNMERCFQTKWIIRNICLSFRDELRWQIQIKYYWTFLLLKLSSCFIFISYLSRTQRVNVWTQKNTASALR